ncbi:MAG TPA: hypothetical protein VHF06_01640 [Pseudonocardiaceae bacterium]|jgi:hypothetical protein|nr:hypothetical protein [Pseudonocardiaceae bacterium]
MRAALLAAGSCLVLAAVCTGCRGTAGSQQQEQPAVPTAVVTQGGDAGGSGTSDDQLGSQLDQLRSTLDSVQARIDADSAP